MKIEHYLSGPLQVNCYLVYDETKEAFIVDPGGYAPSLAASVEQKGLSIAYIVLTHGHGDHIGGVPRLQKEYPQAKLLACKKEEALLSDARQNLSLETVGAAL